MSTYAQTQEFVFEPRGGSSYTFDVVANSAELNGNNAIYNLTGFGGIPQGGIQIPIDLSSRTISPTALLGALTSVPSYVWVLIVAFLGVMLWRATK